MKRKKNIIYRKSISLLAAAAMTAVLMTGQIYPVTAAGQNIESSIKTSSIIPDNVTIDEPVALSEIELPKSDYGTLSWADDTYVPTKRVQSCKVVFKPASDVDLSYLPGWDSEEKVVKGKITVVVTSLEGEETSENDEESTEDSSSPEEPAQDSEKDTVPDSADDENGNTDTSADSTGDLTIQNPTDSDKEEENSDSSSEDSSASEDTEAVGSTVENSETTGENSDGTVQADLLDSAGAENTDSGETSGPEESLTEEILTKDNGESTEAGASDAEDQASASGESQAALEETVTEEHENTELTDKINESLTDIMPGATVFDEKEEAPSEEQEKNIFDNPLDFTVTDTRPNVAAEDLTEEEQAAIAVENHSCEGISVSGIELPWYVQFQVSSGENYEFKNEDKATIFQSYEFKLWDLKNDTEYEIPDGQYISVTIPVKEGYSYSIEHLLDNGATETIVPSVNGSTMVFSTHSFSPFGIAGFRPIVGEEIADNAYGATVTPTPTPTITVSGTPTPSPAVTGVAGNKENGSAGNSGSSAAESTGNASGSAGNSGSGSTAGGGDTGTVGSSGSGSTASGTDISGSGTVGSNSSGSNTSGSSTTSGLGTDNSGSSTAAGENQSGTASTQGNSGQNQTSNAVKTGDNTVILPFVILVFAAVIVIIVVLLVRKKKNK